MSAEIPGYNPENNRTVAQVQERVSKILVATGVDASVAFTTGERSAEYAAELIFTAYTNVFGENRFEDAAFIEEIRRLGSLAAGEAR